MPMRARSRPASSAAQPPHGGRLPRARAALCVVAALGCAVGGWIVYSRLAPDVGVGRLAFAGGGQSLPLPEGTRAALWWDLVFIAGYGAALLICGLVLAPAVFRRQLTKHDARAGDGEADAIGPLAADGDVTRAGAAPMSEAPSQPVVPGETEPAPVARVLLPLAVVGIVADLVENALMLSPSGAAAPRLLDLAVAAGVLKWACLLPAAAVALAAGGVTLVRFWVHRPGRLDEPGYPTVRPPDPLEGDPGVRHPAAGRRDVPAAREAAPRIPEPRGRWLRGFQEPRSLAEAPDQRQPVLGFCLSGGGIRSASVALGALQSLRSELVRSRYLVSVSGGGYTAGALQLALTTAHDPDHPSTGARAGQPAGVYQPGSVEEDRLRRHARYLADSTTQILGALGLVARVLVLSLVAVFAPALVFGWLAGEFYRAVPMAPVRDDPTGPLHVPDVPAGTWLLLAILTAAALAAYVLTLWRKASSEGTGAGARRWARRITALGLLVAVVAVGLPWLVYGAGRLLEASGATDIGLGGPVAGVVVTYAVTLTTLLRRKKVVEGVRGLFGKKGGTTVAAVPGGFLQLLLVAVSLCLLAAGWLVLAGGVAAATTAADPGPVRVAAAGLLVALVVLGGLLDQTELSLHPFYRRRLADAFAARRVERDLDHRVVAEGYSYGEATRLDSYGVKVDGFPQVVFAAAANLTGERRAPLKATSFTMDAAWVGGPDVGYVATGALRRAVAPAFRRDLTVQAAMAVSGAAFASAAGRHTRWYTTLLALSGLRLGTWLPNPVFVDRWNDARRAKDWTTPGLPRLRRLGYLAREVLGIHRWTDRLLQITDGGHYENLGLVEALRRRCTEIYCIDASGDKPPTAGTFAEAVALAYTELGVRIELDDEAWRLVPGSGTPLPPPDPLEALNKRLSDRSVLTARICYPAESGLPEGHRHGILVFAKASLTPRLPYPLLSYAARNEVFPYDSTGDQFFDDGKFTAYSALGRAVGAEAAAAMEAARRQRWSRRRCTVCPPPPAQAVPAGYAAAGSGGTPSQRSSGSPV
ncbi:patatin-like phospholipase family protein [Blastococcus mobilis]|uniref:Patatin-like phospholipase n=1 Tax=Blastococcus mobilis TaxID=1938746 RepID=A0A238UP83_9ACTN|nr:patatin-like phospholipase family protein [Blastococcus mobilis]SNR23427.1 hypothetical protein SAMN06272737_10199 [Blastococcus mobilis]